MIEVLISDFQTLVREGCRRAISDELGVEISGVVTSPEAALKEVRKSEYDVAVLGFANSAKETLDVVEQIRAEHPDRDLRAGR